jgi:hypothetical protein
MRWLLQNFGARLRFTLRNPRYALDSLSRELTLADERFLSAITGSRLDGFVPSSGSRFTRQSLPLGSGRQKQHSEP